jgi:hypothetical protein
MKSAVICSGSLAFLCAAAAGPEVSAQIRTREANSSDAYKTGVAEAEKELQEGNATLYAYGTLEDPEFLDRETGLPYKVIAGCLVNEEIGARAAGHD